MRKMIFVNSVHSKVLWDGEFLASLSDVLSTALPTYCDLHLLHFFKYMVYLLLQFTFGKLYKGIIVPGVPELKSRVKKLSYGL